MTMTTTDTATLTDAASVLKARTMTLSVRTGTFGNSRQASLSGARFTEAGASETAEPDKALLTLSKTLIDSPELAAIRKYDSRTGTLLAKYGRSTMLRPGIVTISLTQVQEVETLLTERAAGRKPLVEDAVAKYPQRVQETIAKLGVLGNPLDYPSVEKFRSRFSFEWQWVQWATPEALRAISPSLYEAERAKFAAEMAAVAEEARQNTRVLLLSMVQHLATRLQPDEAGQPKVLQARTVEKLQSFLRGFAADYDVTGDTELAALVKDARSLLEGVPTSLLKDNEEFRAHVQARLGTIIGKLQPLVGDYARVIKFEDDLAQAS